MIFRWIPNKREFLARAFGQLGLLSLLEQTITRRRPRLVVLTYHRIADPATELFYDPIVSATPEAFRTQVRWLSDRVRLINLDELTDQLLSGLACAEPMMLLTFDDAYRDNFDLAVPLLRERNIPAVFFIPTAFLETPALPWWDYVAYVIKKTNIPRFVIERGSKASYPPVEIDLESLSRTDAIMKIIRAFLDGTIPEERWFLDRLSERCMVNVDIESLGPKLFMSWSNVREIADSDAALAIGSHTHSHHNLATLDADTQRDELARSKHLLEAKLKREIKALAYPYGWPKTYTTQTKALTAEAGYQLAFSAHEGVNRPGDFDRYEVKRLGVGSADSVALLRARSALHVTFGRSFV